MARDIRRLLDDLASLRQAQQLLSDGKPEQALDALGGVDQESTKGAAPLRRRCLDGLCREAARLAERGEGDEAVRLIDRVGVEDEELAERGLERIRAQVGAGWGPGRRGEEADESTEAAAEGSAGVRFQMAIDEGGQLLVHTGERLVLGHAHSAAAHLPFLADVGPAHALLERAESLRGGPGWRITALEDAHVEINGERAGGEPQHLSPGAEVQLAQNLSFRLSQPDPSSASVVLELLRGAECVGGGRVLLFAGGVAGRVRIGPGAGCHVQVAGLEGDVSMVRAGTTLVLASASGLAREEAACEPAQELPCPPPRRIDLRVGTPAEGDPPYCISLSPIGTALQES